MNRENKRRVNIIRPFLIGNLGLIVLAGFFWLYPAAASWNSARQITNHQRQIYTIYTMQAQQQEEHSVTEPSSGRILYYGQLAAAMADIYNLALYHGLEAINFDSVEWFDHVDYIYEGRFIERRVSATFFGTTCQAAAFVYGLADSAAFIRTMRMDFLEDEMATLRVEFSLFGRGE